MFAAAYYNEISWDQNKRPSKNFNSYGSAETEMHFSFPHIRVLSARLQPWRAAAGSCFSAVQNALRDPAFLLHSTFAQRAMVCMVCGRKDFGNPKQEMIGRFLPGNMGRGISS